MNDLSNFQYIWTEWIEPLADDLYGQLDDGFKKFCKVEKRNFSKIRYKAEMYYQKKRQEIKKVFYGRYNKGDSASDHRMDFHKIGAILCRTMIEYKLFQFDIHSCKQYIDLNIKKYDTDWVVKNALINFRLAFYVSVVFLYQSMIFKYSEENVALCAKLRKNRNLDLYVKQTNITACLDDQVHESFENCIVLDLAKRDLNNHSFDYFMYAIILYQLEEYNRGLLENK